MEGLILHEEPDVKLPTMVVAFAGWPDAAEAATGAVNYLVQKLETTKLAEIDHEEFYDFTVVRPRVRIDVSGERAVSWPTNEFYYATASDGPGSVLLFVGTEPSLRWRAFSRIMLEVAERCGVETVVSLGALNDAVPHTREPRVTGVASDSKTRDRLGELGVHSSGYEGPTGIHTAFMEACTRKGLPVASLWGHNPHYLSSSTNPRISLALLVRLQSIADIGVDLEELRAAADAFGSELTKAIGDQTEIASYVTELEQQYDAALGSPGDIPSPAAMVEELEEFLRRQRHDG